MNACNKIDTAFDFRSDIPAGKDPDTHSPTLRMYHKLLWSKPLPLGILFELTDAKPHPYLYHKSAIGEFWLSSDAVIPTFTRETKIKHIIDEIPENEIDFFQAISYTIGGMIIFPAHRIGRKMTINGARGFHPRIKDRFDLTVECIRRFYLGDNSPLKKTLERYADYFRLFQNFRGFVEFFLLEDIVQDDFSAVKIFTPFDDFKTSPIPSTMKAYIDYKELAIKFIKARNYRIYKYSLTMDKTFQVPPTSE
jgi:hypothetical protein